VYAESMFFIEIQGRSNITKRHWVDEEQLY